VGDPNRDPFFFRERSTFNRFNLLKALLVVGPFLGFFYRGAWIFVLTEISLLAFLYFKTKQLAEMVDIKRTAPLRAREQDYINFKITIINQGNFSHSDFIVRDTFSGSSQSFYSALIESGVKSGEEHTITFKTYCNGGMGKHSFGPIHVFVRDPFGLFNFVVTFPSTHPIEIYPKILLIPSIPIRKGTFSLNYGNLVSEAKGLSTNIQGVREYRPRDSFRHISWRLSAKRNQLLVKEFDHLVSTDIAIFLDVDLAHHTGFKSDSTWEYAKDLANSIICQQLEAGNSIQLLTNFFVTENKRGESHRNELLTLISKTKERVDTDSRSLEERYFGLVSPGATLIHIGPVYLKNTDSFLHALTKFRAQGNDILLYLIDPLSFVRDRAEFSNPHFKSALHSLDQEFKYLETLGLKGFQFKFLKRSQSVAHAFIESQL